MRIKAIARVQLTVEIEVPDVWGDACTIGQLNAQAKEAALTQIQKSIPEHRIIGSPKVIGVITEQ